MQDRTNDTAPFAGGDVITLGGAATCTSGATVVGNASGNTFMLTAGHCGTVNSTVQTHGLTMGHVTNVRLCNGCIDSETVSGNYAPVVWGGPGLNNNPLYDEDGSFTAASKGGATVCHGGDSGGPWFQHEGNTGNVKIVGTHVGGNATTCFYEQVDAITTWFNVSVP